MRTAASILLGTLVILAPLILSSQSVRGELTVQGTVSKITHPEVDSTHVWLDSAGKSQEVCLGETRLLVQNGFNLEEGNSIEVTGTMSGPADSRLLVADSIKQGGRTLQLRDESAAQSSGSHGAHHCWDHDHNGHHCCGHGYHHDGHE